MHFKNHEWTFREICELKDQIDEKPQFQRGDVWRVPQRQLLLDSIFRGYDIPKLYLNSIDGPRKYEVTDGQQRLTALWAFADDSYQLGTLKGNLSHLSGQKYSQLSEKDKAALDNYIIVTAVSYDGSSEDIRELFTRLQKGIKLTPPELRNSMPGTIANVVRSIAISHDFFKKSNYTSARYKTDDLVAHAFAIEIYSPGSIDLKAPTLARIYKEHASQLDNDITKKVNETLKVMTTIQGHSSKAIKTKWGFVDVYAAISKRGSVTLDEKELARRYEAFETKRKRHLGNPTRLLPLDQDMYEYIVAFQTSGAEKKNVLKRTEILSTKLFLIK